MSALFKAEILPVETVEFIPCCLRLVHCSTHVIRAVSVHSPPVTNIVWINYLRLFFCNKNFIIFFFIAQT